MTRTTEETVEHLRKHHIDDKDFAKQLAEAGMEDLADRVFQSDGM